MVHPRGNFIAGNLPTRRRLLSIAVLWCLLAGVMTAVVSTAGPAQAGFEPGESWVTDGTVLSIVHANDRIYIGGNFSKVGPNTGGGAVVAASSGLYDASVGTIDGSIYAAVPDGSGGWYIGGDFNFVGDRFRPGLAHLEADGDASSWSPDLAGGVVRTLVLDGTTLYVGGEFTEVEGISRVNLAALNVATNDVVVTSWDPATDDTVHSLVMAGGVIYAGGEFLNVNGTARSRLAAFDSAGALTAWDPGADGTVFAVAADQGSNRIIVGGNFGNVSGVGRSNVAGIDITTGLADAWAPEASAIVMAVAVDGSEVVLGGGFTTVGGAVRERIARIDGTTGLATTWSPVVDGLVNGVAVDGSTTYIAGGFETVAGTTRSGLAAIDAAGAATAFDPDANAAAFVVSPSGSDVLVGGEFGSVNGVSRANIAALDAETGVLITAFNAAANGEVSVLEASADGATIYVGGKFTEFNGVARGHLVAVNAANGSTRATFTGEANLHVRSFHLLGGVLYAGGDFSNIGGRFRVRLAALDPTTGDALTGWNPHADGSVRAMASSPDGSLLYVGGLFDTLDGLVREEIGAVSIATGDVDAGFNPGTDRRVYDFAVTADSVFVAMGGGGGRLFAFHPVNGSTQWEVAGDGDFQSVVVRGDRVYSGGHFHNAGGESPDFLLAANVVTGAVDTSWNASASGGNGVFAITDVDGRLWMGGEFDKLTGRAAHHVGHVEALPYAFPGNYRDRVRGDSAVVYYRFDESAGTIARDDIGDLDATYAAGAAPGAAPLVPSSSGSASFDGVNDSVTVPGSSLINGSGPFEATTVELWFNAVNTSSRQVLWEQGGSTRGLNIYLQGGNVYFGAWNTLDDGDGTTPWGPKFISAPIVAGVDTHVALRFDMAADSLTGFVDGEPVVETANVGRLFAHAHASIGAVAVTTNFHTGPSSATSAFEGRIDEVAVYGEALTSARLASHFLVGSLAGVDPGVMQIAPTAGETLAGTHNVVVAAEDPQQVEGSLDVEVSIDGGSWLSAAWNAAADAYVFTWDTTTVADGNHTVKARATDPTGNRDVGPSVQVITDNFDQAPTVRIASPKAGTVVEGTRAIRVNASDVEDAAGTLDVEVSVDGGSTWLPATYLPAQDRYRLMWNTTASPNGALFVKARATDSSNNVTISKQRKVVVANYTGYPGLVISDVPSVYFRLDDKSGVDVTDTVAHVNAKYRNDPTLGAVPLVTDSVHSVRFDGRDDRIFVPNNKWTTREDPIEARTIEFWFKPDDVATRQVIFEEGGAPRGIILYIQNGKLFAGAWNRSDHGDGTTPWATDLFTSTPISADVTYHVALVIDQPNGKMHLYLNGSLKKTLTGAGRIFPHKGASIGSMSGKARFHFGVRKGVKFFYDGLLDEFVIYSAALSSGEVAAHHAAGS